MNVICHHCKTKLNIPDNKLSKDKETTFRCPKCKEKVQVPGVNLQIPVSENKSVAGSLLFEDRLNALVCIDNDALKEQVSPIILQMGLNSEIVADVKTALNKMDYRIYHLVLIDDAFDQDNKGVSVIIDKLNTMDMSLRRRICLVLLSQKFNTNDNMAALHSSVNSILHRDDIFHLETFLSRVLAEHKNLYTVYNESLKLIGKA